jgi:hypothetical protein
MHLPPRPRRASLVGRLLPVMLLAHAAACDRTREGGAPTAGVTGETTTDTARASEEIKREFRSTATPTSRHPACAQTPPEHPHWVRQQVPVMRPPAPGQRPAFVTRATLTSERRSRGGKNRYWKESEVVLGWVRLDDALDGLEAGKDYCVTAAYAGDDVPEQLKDAARWRMFVYAPGDAGGPVKQMPFEFRKPEVRADAPDPPWRLDLLRESEHAELQRETINVPTNAPSSGTLGKPASLALALGARVAGARQPSALRASSTWYRCGDGCCGGAFAFF